MKFTRFHLLILLVLITAVLSFSSKTSTHTRSKLKSRMRTKMHSVLKNKASHGSKKAMSYLGFMNSIGSSYKGPSPTKKKKNMSLEKKTQVGNLWNSTKLVENWMSISSKSFIDRQKFPDIILPDNTRAQIKTDEDMFRINDAYGFNFTSSTDKPPSTKSFYARLSGTYIYYSPTPSDYNILGSIKISKVESVGPQGNGITGNGLFCVKVIDVEEQQWKLCNSDEIVRKQWLCRIQFTLQMALDNSCYNGIVDDEYESSYNVKHVIRPIILIPTPSKYCNGEWDYQRNGKDWECECKEGRAQSPINLPEIKKVIDSKVKPLFQYEEIAYQKEETGADGQKTKTNILKLEIEKGTLQIKADSFGKLITMDGAKYNAHTIKIHTPGQHKIDHKRFDVEVEIIHQGITKGDIAKQVILSFMFEKKPGYTAKFIDDIDVFNLPSVLNPRVDLTTNININALLYDSEYKDSVVSKPFSFYTYQGSLTAPPCTEDTIVYVASKPIGIGTTALQLLKEAIRVPDFKDKDGNMIQTHIKPVNNRETQDKNGRPIYHYDHTKYCNVEELQNNEKPKGHYEKFVAKVNKYIFVNSQYPSGTPGSYVVSEDEAKGNPIDLNQEKRP
jgi:carbonic anhydrase